MAAIETPATLTLDKIVLATDFSPASEQATAYAQALAKKFASHITVTHVVDLSVATRSEEAVVGFPIDRMRHDSAENMERTINELTEQGLQAQCRTEEAHTPARAVVRVTEELKANLLILGTNARRGLERAILGSFAEAAIHHARCPVLTIGPSVPHTANPDIDFRNVVFATDLHHQAAAKAAIALAFAEESLARVTLCHVIEHPADELTDALEEQFKTESALRKLIPNAAYDWCKPGVAVVYGGVPEKILRLAGVSHADLLVLGARRNSTWLLHPSQGVAAQVIRDASCPVMTITSD